MKLTTLFAARPVFWRAALLAACGGGDDDEAGSPTRLQHRARHGHAERRRRTANPDSVRRPGRLLGRASEVFVYGGAAPYRLDNTQPDYDRARPTGPYPDHGGSASRVSRWLHEFGDRDGGCLARAGRRRRCTNEPRHAAVHRRGPITGRSHGQSLRDVSIAAPVTHRWVGSAWPRSPIALVGMPGGGKSTVGRHLARQLRPAFHRLRPRDRAAHRRARSATSSSAKAKRRFRDIEQEVIAELCARRPRGAGHRRRGRAARGQPRALHDDATVIYLRSTPEELFRRLRHDTQRPLLQVRDPLRRLRELYARARPAVPRDGALRRSRPAGRRCRRW